MKKSFLEKNLSDELETKYYFLKDELESKILPFMSTHVPYFPDHGIGHSVRIIENMNKILSYKKGVDISSLDSYVLLCSAYLHDIGNLISEKDGKKLTKAQIRGIHHELSCDWIKNNYKQVGIKNKHIANLMANVCRCHRRRTSIEYDLEEDYSIGNEPIHPRFISSILRIGDALDTDHRRAPEITSEYVMSLPEKNKKHWYACQMISGFDLLNNVIVIRAEINDINDEQIVRWKTMDLYDELWPLKDIFSINKLPIIDVNCNLKNNATGKTKKFKGKELFKDIKIEELRRKMVSKALEESNNFKS